MILSCSNVSKLFGKKHILEQASFHLEDHERTVVVRIDSAGRSTLLKVIIGEPTSDEGYVTPGRKAPIGYLAQHQDLDSENTIHDVLLGVKRPILQMEERIRTLELNMESASGKSLEAMLEGYSRLTHQFELGGDYAYRSEITGVLKDFSFTGEEFPKPINVLSDGQKTRVSLDKLLLTKPDVLPLGEPTNHLDMEFIVQLGTYLKTYSGSIIIITHDHYPLGRVVIKVVELDNGTGTVFSGNYTVYSDKGAVLHGARTRVHLNQQQEIRHQGAAIAKLKSSNRGKSTRRTESREKMLEKTDQLEKPMDIDDSMDIRPEPDVESGKDVLIVIGLSESSDNQTLLTDVNFEIKCGEWVATIGNSGTDKTTLLKITNQLLSANADGIRLGSKMHIGYHDQEHQVLHMDRILFDKIQDTYPSMNSTQIRSILASLLFAGDDVFKLICDLSGSERERVSLAELMLFDVNFLLLDEPTSRLSITSKEILESTLCRYIGTVLYMSHDWYLINRTTTRILGLIGQSLISYTGSYDHYLEKKDAVEAAFATRNERTPSAPNLSQALGRPSQDSQDDLKLGWKTQKGEQARTRRIQNELKKAGDPIHALETRDSEVDALLTWEEVYTDVLRLMELNKEKEKIAGQLEKLYQSWEELTEKA